MQINELNVKVLSRIIYILRYYGITFAIWQCLHALVGDLTVSLLHRRFVLLFQRKVSIWCYIIREYKNLFIRTDARLKSAQTVAVGESTQKQNCQGWERVENIYFKISVEYCRSKAVSRLINMFVNNTTSFLVFVTT